jgi:hypothetical protein
MPPRGLALRIYRQALRRDGEANEGLSATFTAIAESLRAAGCG